MGRGRAKAKQTKVARDLKYRSHETDFGALARELHGDSDNSATTTDEVADDEDDEWAGYAEPRSALTDLDRPGAGPPSPVMPARGAHGCSRDAPMPAQRRWMPRSRPTSRDPALGEPVRGHRRRDAVGLGEREDLLGGVVDRLGRGALARSKEKPSSSSATWIRPPALTT